MLLIEQFLLVYVPSKEKKKNMIILWGISLTVGLRTAQVAQVWCDLINYHIKINDKLSKVMFLFSDFVLHQIIWPSVK